MNGINFLICKTKFLITFLCVTIHFDGKWKLVCVCLCVTICLQMMAMSTDSYFCFLFFKFGIEYLNFERFQHITMWMHNCIYFFEIYWNEHRTDFEWMNGWCHEIMNCDVEMNRGPKCDVQRRILIDIFMVISER